MARKGKAQVIFTAKVANGVGVNMDVDPYDNVILTIIAYDTAVGKIKVQGYDQLAEPDFSAAADETNPWVFKHSYDEDSGSGVQGSTGVTISADIIHELNVDTDNLKYLNAQLSAYSSGKFTIIARGIRKVR